MNLNNLFLHDWLIRSLNILDARYQLILDAQVAAVGAAEQETGREVGGSAEREGELVDAWLDLIVCELLQDLGLLKYNNVLLRLTLAARDFSLLLIVFD